MSSVRLPDSLFLLIFSRFFSFIFSIVCWLEPSMNQTEKKYEWQRANEMFKGYIWYMFCSGSFLTHTIHSPAPFFVCVSHSPRIHSFANVSHSLHDAIMGFCFHFTHHRQSTFAPILCFSVLISSISVLHHFSIDRSYLQFKPFPKNALAIHTYRGYDASGVLIALCSGFECSEFDESNNLNKPSDLKLAQAKRE